MQPHSEFALRFKTWSSAHQFKVDYVSALSALRKLLALQQSHKMALAVIPVEDTVNAAFRNDLARNPMSG